MSQDNEPLPPVESIDDIFIVYNKMIMDKLSLNSYFRYMDKHAIEVLKRLHEPMSEKIAELQAKGAPTKIICAWAKQVMEYLNMQTFSRGDTVSHEETVKRALSTANNYWELYQSIYLPLSEKSLLEINLQKQDNKAENRPFKL